MLHIFGFLITSGVYKSIQYVKSDKFLVVVHFIVAFMTYLLWENSLIFKAKIRWFFKVACYEFLDPHICHIVRSLLVLIEI